MSLVTLKQFPTCHCHPSSIDSGSKPEDFAQREVELGSGYVTMTDHGTLEATMRIYDMCAPGGAFHGKLKFIPGIELFLRDDNCPLILSTGTQKDKNGTLTQYSKYFHVTAHFQDEAALNKAIQLTSVREKTAETHGGERKPIFTWNDLEELGSHNVTMTSSCLIGAVQRHLMDHDNFEMAEKYYQKLRSVVKPGNFYVEVFPHTCESNWEEKTVISLENENKLDVRPTKILITDAGKITATELYGDYRRDKWSAIKKYGRVLGFIEQRKEQLIEPAMLTNIEQISGPIANECRPWSPDGKVQVGANKFVLEMAKKYGDLVLPSDDSHLATPDAKIIQDIILTRGGKSSWKFVTSYHRMSSQEAFERFQENMGTKFPEFERWVDNSLSWASGFDNFKISKQKSLPEGLFPTDTLSYLKKLIKEKGRVINTPEHKERLMSEIELLHNNGTIDLNTYFFTCEKVISEAQQRGMITGPGRGSAGGLLMAYYLGITHVDPLQYDLSRDRFITLDRIQSKKMPDIDMDFADRNMLTKPTEVTVVTDEQGQEHIIYPGQKLRTADGRFVSAEDAIANDENIIL